MMQAADVLRYLPNSAVAEQRHRRRMGRVAGRFGAVGEFLAASDSTRRASAGTSARVRTRVPATRLRFRRRVMAFEHDIDSPPAFACVAAGGDPDAV